MTHTPDQQEAEQHPWLIADEQYPADVGELAASIGMVEAIREMWRGAFIAGYRYREAAAKADSHVVTEGMVEERYRIMSSAEGFEPQMRYTAGAVEGEFWYPLNSQGFWLEPDAFSHGNPKIHNYMPTREEALRVVERARLINSDGQIIRSAALSPERK